MFELTLLVADPGFSRRGPIIPDFGAKTYYLTRFLPKTASNWTGGFCPGCLCPGMFLSKGASLSRGSLSRGVSVWEAPFLTVNRMTHRSKNITLPQTSFAGGNNVTMGYNDTAVYMAIKSL